MKKTMALILALILMYAAFGVSAAAGEPLYGTIGDALAAAGEQAVAGGEDDYYAVVTEKDGKYYRSFAQTDEKYDELQQAIWEAEPEQMEAALAAADEYLKTLPVTGTEEFTAVPMSQEEISALTGKTLGELREAGYEDESSGTEEDGITYVMRNGLFDYKCVVDADFEAYEKAQEEWPDGGKDFVIRSAALDGITGQAFLKRFHTDGTVEEIQDPLAEFLEVTSAVEELFGRIRNGEEVNTEEFFNGLKEQHPDMADTIDMYLEVYNTLGVEGLAAMMASEE